MNIPIFHLPGNHVTVIWDKLSLKEWDEPTRNEYKGKTGTIVSGVGEGRYLVRFDEPARIPFSSNSVIMTHDIFNGDQILPSALNFLNL